MNSNYSGTVGLDCLEPQATGIWLAPLLISRLPAATHIFQAHEATTAVNKRLTLMDVVTISAQKVARAILLGNNNDFSRGAVKRGHPKSYVLQQEEASRNMEPKAFVEVRIPHL